MDFFTDVHMTICGHNYCKECIIDWISRNPVCPACKENLDDYGTITKNFHLEQIFDKLVNCRKGSVTKENARKISELREEKPKETTSISCQTIPVQNTDINSNKVTQEEEKVEEINFDPSNPVDSWLQNTLFNQSDQNLHQGATDPERAQILNELNALVQTDPCRYYGSPSTLEQRLITSAAILSTSPIPNTHQEPYFNEAELPGLQSYHSWHESSSPYPTSSIIHTPPVMKRKRHRNRHQAHTDGGNNMQNQYVVATSADTSPHFTPSLFEKKRTNKLSRQELKAVKRRVLDKKEEVRLASEGVSGGKSSFLDVCMN